MLTYFETLPENGIIKIPNKYKKLCDAKVRVIFLKEENNELEKVNTASKLKDILSGVKANQLFRTIQDPVEWQKKQRDEWK